jgi:conjugal transfer/entry exclusion protein
VYQQRCGHTRSCKAAASDGTVTAGQSPAPLADHLADRHSRALLFQASTLKSDKNASKSVRDKLKAMQAAAAICDEQKRQKMTSNFNAAKNGPKTL